MKEQLYLIREDGPRQTENITPYWNLGVNIAFIKVVLIAKALYVVRDNYNRLILLFLMRNKK